MRELLICLLWNAAFRTACGALDVDQGAIAFMREVRILNESTQDLQRLVYELQEKLILSQECSDDFDIILAGNERQLSQSNASSTPGSALSTTSGSAPSTTSGSASSTPSGSSAANDDHGAHHSHQHDALVYFVFILVVGTAVLHITMFQAFHNLPFTVVLFVLGMVTSGIMQNMPDTLGILGESYEMWMDIDPHLMIFTMLPVLLTGDAMALDTSVAKRVSNQCIWLAGPGVLMGSFGTASFLWVYMGWDFLLCLCCGAILSATDPVAVVGLLKELGASPTLTVQIQGESLLNDGTAMVLFNVAYKMLQGESHNVKSILILLVYMVGCSWFLGMVIGGIFSTWIKVACNRLEHNSNMVQIMLTICCAYMTFVFAEGVIGLNGVLSTVATALVLADNIWPKIVSPEAMHEVWHTFEYIGNTLIFFLAGAIGGRSLFLVTYMDVVHLMIIYVVLLFLRASVMFGSRPVLRLLSPDRTPVSAADAALMTWGGLRGAVGLALSMQVMRDQAGGNIAEAEATRVFFFTAGIAFLTLIINATTCPTLVDSFGIASTSTCKTKVMLDVVQRMAEKCEGLTDMVKHNIDHMLSEVREHLTRGLDPVEFERWSALQRTRQLYSEGHSEMHALGIGSHLKIRDGQEVVDDFMRAKKRFMAVPNFDKKLLGWNEDSALLTQEKDIITLALEEPNPPLVRTITEAFLQLVRGELWELIQQGEFVDGSKSVDVLLNSNTRALQYAERGLTDYENVRNSLGIMTLDSGEISITHGSESPSPQSNESPDLSTSGVAVERDVGCAERLVKSPFFEGTILLVITCNAVVIFMDPGPGSEDSLMFTIIDCFFMLFYLTEFIIKLKVLGKRYFLDAWNALDFMCVLLGLFAITTAFLVEADVLRTNTIASEMMLIRLARVFKVLRLMRIAGLVKFVRKMHAQYKGKRISPTLSVHLEFLFTIRGFVQSHVRSHTKFLRYFGAQKQRCVCGNKLMPDSNFCRKCGTERPADMPKGSFSKIGSCEHARVVLESWTAIFNASVVAHIEITECDSDGAWILEALSSLRETVGVTNDLTNFVMEAAKNGVILPKLAEEIIHPMHHHVREADQLLAEVHTGILGHVIKKHSDGRRASEAASGDLAQFSGADDCASEPEASTEDDKTKPEDVNEEKILTPGSERAVEEIKIADAWDRKESDETTRSGRALQEIQEVLDDTNGISDDYAESSRWTLGAENDEDFAI